VAHEGAWIGANGRLVLIGDAAHAMTPFSAQGAAMAIEDAAMLADSLSGAMDDPAAALARFESRRKPRIARVVRRGAFNRFTWHASGPVALARNAILAARSGAGLMHDFDWLYGFDATCGG
ncbi:MAG: FAD-dependent monooxygenase, partial [Rhizobiaceae bacterium]